MMYFVRTKGSAKEGGVKLLDITEQPMGYQVTFHSTKEIFIMCLMLLWSGCQKEEETRGAGDAEESGRGSCSEHEHQAGAVGVSRAQCHP